MEVTEEKKDRIKAMAKELLGKSLVTAKETAAFTGLVISCAPAVGRSARFCTRFSVAWCQALVDRSNWGAKGLCEVQGDRADRKEISDNSGGVGEEVEFNLQRTEVHRAWVGADGAGGERSGCQDQGG